MFYSNAKRHQNIKTRTSNEIHNEKIKSYKKTIMELDNRTFTQLVMLAISDGYRKSNILCKTVRANFRKTLSIVYDHSFITNAKFSEKITFPNPWGAYQELGNVRFSEKFAYVPNEWSLFNCYILYWVKKYLKKFFCDEIDMDLLTGKSQFERSKYAWWNVRGYRRYGGKIIDVRWRLIIPINLEMQQDIN